MPEPHAEPFYEALRESYAEWRARITAFPPPVYEPINRWHAFKLRWFPVWLTRISPVKTWPVPQEPRA